MLYTKIFTLRDKIIAVNWGLWARALSRIKKSPTYSACSMMLENCSKWGTHASILPPSRKKLRLQALAFKIMTHWCIRLTTPASAPVLGYKLQINFLFGFEAQYFLYFQKRTNLLILVDGYNRIIYSSWVWFFFRFWESSSECSNDFYSRLKSHLCNKLRHKSLWQDTRMTTTKYLNSHHETYQICISNIWPQFSFCFVFSSV